MTPVRFRPDMISDLLPWRTRLASAVVLCLATDNAAAVGRAGWGRCDAARVGPASSGAGDTLVTEEWVLNAGHARLQLFSWQIRAPHRLRHAAWNAFH